MRRLTASVLTALFCACAQAPTVDDLFPDPASTGPSESGGAGAPDVLEEDLVPVVRVVDGDTIRVVRDGVEEPVRLIGIDTPEMGFSGGIRECFAREASRFTARHLEGARVQLELDVEHRDRYGRLLAYVWLDGRMFNEVIVRRGFASVATYPPNVRYVDRFLTAERLARTEGQGLWSAC